jgi:TPR repeat protein
MPTIIISGPAQGFAGDPNGEPIKDPKILARFHGLVSDDECADLLDEPPLSEIGLTGGRLRFVFEPKTPELRIITAYYAPRRLTKEETDLLVEATRAQWSDGCGSGSFENFYGPVLSTALAMAMLNSGSSKDEIGDHFVDAFPMDADDDQTRVEVLKADDGEKSDLDYLKEAVALGEPHAQFQLAQQLEEGEEIDKDERLAFEHYYKAARQGHMPALTHLGLCLQKGTGHEQDLERAVKCFEKAAKADFPLAMHCLGECYFEGRGVAANPSEGIQWYRRGAKLDDMGCTAQLGDCYEFGNGVAQDLKRALDLYQRCLDEGFDAVEPAIKRVKKQLKKSGGK